MRDSRAILSPLIAVLGYCSVALVYGRLSCVLVCSCLLVSIGSTRRGSHELDGLLLVVASERPLHDLFRTPEARGTKGLRHKLPIVTRTGLVV